VVVRHPPLNVVRVGDGGGGVGGATQAAGKCVRVAATQPAQARARCWKMGAQPCVARGRGVFVGAKTIAIRLCPPATPTLRRL
jgi:hypothetical protein